MQFTFVFCSKGMKTIQTIKTTIIFDKISLKNADSFFLLQDNAIVLILWNYLHFSLSGIIKRITSFSQLGLCFKT